jgi:hypothetical protein
MADPNSLIAFATQKRGVLQTDLDSAVTRLANAKQDFASAVQAHKQAVDDLTAANQTIIEIKKQLAEIAMPADGEPLLDDLRDAIIDQRTKASAATAADFDRGRAGATLDLAAADLQAITQELAGAGSAADKATADKQKRDAAIAALAQAPISEVRQQATDALAGSDFSAAEQRIESALPAALRNRARQRVEQAAGWLTSANSIRDQACTSYHEIAEGGQVNAATVERLSQDVLDAERALCAYVARAMQDLAAAAAVLTYLADPQTDQLSDEERALIHDAALASEREQAASKEAARDTAALAETEKRALLEIERIKVLAADPNADLGALEADNTTDVGQAKAACDQASASLASAEANFSTAERQTLSEWQAAVPHFLWQDVSSFYRAKAELNRLSADPATLVSGLQAAEGALLAALITQEAQRQRLRHTAATLSERGAEAEQKRLRISQYQADAWCGALML